MLRNQILVAVCAGRDAARAQANGLSYLHFYLALSEDGAVQRTSLPTIGKADYIGLCEPKWANTALPYSQIAAQLCFLLKEQGAKGLFADFEHNNPQSRALLDAIDAKLADENLRLFVPHALGYAPQNTIVTVPTAISGGSLRLYIQELQQQYGKNRIAAFLLPISQDFVLPSNKTEGEPLTEAERAQLLTQYGAQAFFSGELCAKYFTYTDKAGRAHFALFDDPSTLQAKVHQLSQLGLSHIFALWPDAAALIDDTASQAE